MTGIPNQPVDLVSAVYNSATRTESVAHVVQVGDGGFGTDLFDPLRFPVLRAPHFADPEVSARLDEDALAALFDLDHHVRQVDRIFERVFGPDATH